MPQKTDAAQTKTKKKEVPKFPLQLNQQEVNQLNQMLNELPGKFCNPLFQFFNLIMQKRQIEQSPPKDKGSNEELNDK